MNDPQVLTPRRTEYGKRIRKDYEAGRKREKMQYESLRAENGRHKQHSDNGSERQLCGDVAIIDAVYKSRRERVLGLCSYSQIRSMWKSVSAGGEKCLIQ